MVNLKLVLGVNAFELSTDASFEQIHGFLQAILAEWFEALEQDADLDGLAARLLAKADALTSAIEGASHA